MENIINKAKLNNNLNKNEIVSLLTNNEINNYLFSNADEVRKKFVGDEVHLRALIEASNICKQNCLYCGLRRDNKLQERYKLSSEKIIDLAKNAKDLGYKTIVLQSGESNVYSLDEMLYIITNINKLDLALTLSIGEKTKEEYQEYKKAGANRYLLRIETTDKILYEKMNPEMSFENRLKCLQILKELNYEVGTGCLVGLPEQSIESLAEDILFFKSIDADMIGIGPFIPHENTPLKDIKDKENKNFELALKVMAITRLLLPDINIPATTAMETLNPNGRLIALQSGANVIMPNVTDNEYKKLYELYPGKICLNDNASKCRHCITNKIESINRKVSKSFGYRKKINF